MGQQGFQAITNKASELSLDESRDSDILEGISEKRERHIEDF